MPSMGSVATYQCGPEGDQVVKGQGHGVGDSAVGPSGEGGGGWWEGGEEGGDATAPGATRDGGGDWEKGDGEGVMVTAGRDVHCGGEEIGGSAGGEVHTVQSGEAGWAMECEGGGSGMEMAEGVNVGGEGNREGGSGGRVGGGGGGTAGRAAVEGGVGGEVEVTEQNDGVRGRLDGWLDDRLSKGGMAGSTTGGWPIGVD